jgi:hypothetical protein
VTGAIGVAVTSTFATLDSAVTLTRPQYGDLAAASVVIRGNQF